MKNSGLEIYSKGQLQIVFEKYKVVKGQHIYGNLDDIENKEILTDADKILGIAIKAADVGNMHIVDILKHKFVGKGEGVSVIAILKESHISIHTWPEGNYATVDIYSCGEKSDPHAAFNYIIKLFNPKKCDQFFSDRSK